MEPPPRRDTLSAVKVTPPSNPFHLARAYAVAPPEAVRAETPLAPVSPVTRREPADSPARRQPSNVDRLVAARVPGRIDFDTATGAPAPDPRTHAIPLYRHPADLNAAATTVHAGRTIDLSA